MISRTITYTDYNGTQRTEDFYFNLNKAELLMLQTGKDGGMAAALQKMLSRQDIPNMMSIFKEIILSAYGEKTEDGRGFRKSSELSRDFEQTEAFSELFMKIMTSDEEAASFINGLIPQSVLNEIAKSQNQANAQ